jgi:hypothetical protein
MMCAVWWIWLVDLFLPCFGLNCTSLLYGPGEMELRNNFYQLSGLSGTRHRALPMCLAMS